ncbi:MAG TPA: 30S ribosomal protein S6 [Thermodesulfobacteriota bacterium]|nr:30S ribosomal protein S6 [Thermodesulfobacteriota bacterium]
MRRYETIYITPPELTEEELSELQQKISSILANYQGDLLKLEDWGTKKLTYEIRKNNRGRFFLMDYLAGTDLIRELERNLRLSDRVLRFQTVRIADQVSPEAAQAIKEQTVSERQPPKIIERSEAAAADKPPEPAPATAPEQTAATEGGEQA